MPTESNYGRVSTVAIVIEIGNAPRVAIGRHRPHVELGSGLLE